MDEIQLAKTDLERLSAHADILVRVVAHSSITRRAHVES